MNFASQVMEKDKPLPFDIDYIPEIYRRKAEIELNESPGSSSRLLQQLKYLAKNESTTMGIEFQEDFLRQFLRQSKYDVQKALKRLQSFVNFKRNNSRFFKHVDPEKIAKTPDYKYCTVLPWRCRDGCTITLFEMSKWDTRGITNEDLIRLGLIIYQQSLRNPMSQINGFKMIVDWKDSHLRQLKYMSPQILYASYQAFLDCTPARNKEIHMVNESLTMKAMWSIFKVFLSEKLKSRIIFHSSPKSLLKYFPKYALPVQYGGDLQNYYMEKWMLEANEQQKVAMLNGQSNHF